MTSIAVRSPSRCDRGRDRVLAASPRGDYRPEPQQPHVHSPIGTQDATGSDTPSQAGGTGGGSGHAGLEVAAVEELLAHADAVGALDLAMLSDVQLEAHLARLRRPIAVLEAARARALSESERRVRRTAAPGRVTGEVLEHRRRAARGQQMSPSEAKRAAEAGGHADNHRATAQAFQAGDVGPTHVRLLGAALDRIPAEGRAAAEHELLELARNSDPVAFGRQIRRYLAAHAPHELQRQEQGQHRQRRFSMADTPDGGVAFSGLAYGIAAELARTALDAFRRPDAADEHRTPEQRGADAFEQLCDAALRLGDAPTIHGERPQVILVVEASELDGDLGSARFARSAQPVTLAEAGILLTDCEVSRLVRDADGIPLEVTRTVRTVPMGLWRALIVRDGGCRWEGCDAPASWCDVAHGEHPYRSEGRLSPANAVLLCRRHHRRFDRGPWRLEIDGDAVTFLRDTSAEVHPLDRGQRATDGRTEDPANDEVGHTGSPKSAVQADGAAAARTSSADAQGDPGQHPHRQGEPARAGPAQAAPARAGPARAGPPGGQVNAAQLGLTGL